METTPVVNLAKFPENPSDMYSRYYYTVCLMDGPDVIGRVYRGRDQAAMRTMAEAMARNHNLELIDETC